MTHMPLSETQAGAFSAVPGNDFSVPAKKSVRIIQNTRIRIPALFILLLN